jgi:hypothetical protein
VEVVVVSAAQVPDRVQAIAVELVALADERADRRTDRVRHHQIVRLEAHWHDELAVLGWCLDDGMLRRSGGVVWSTSVVI